MLYNIYEYDGHMLVKAFSNITEDTLETYGKKSEKIYSDYDGRNQSGWILINKEDDVKYYAFQVKK
jgi:hypothetical protein